MAEARPTISVVLPVYNGERYLAEAVESILAQTFADFELLIVDDGSQDRSLEILRRYAERDARIRLTSRPNAGLVPTLNEMLARARGEFIARMDADDVALPERFARELAYLRTHSECLAVGTAVEWIDPEGELLKRHVPLLGHDEIDAAHLRTREAEICHPSALVRASAFERVGVYDPALDGAEDLDLWLRIAEVGKLANLPEPLLRYRFHFAKVGFVAKRRQVEAARQAVLRACERRKLELELPLAEVAIPDVSRQLETWAWWALASGNAGTARKYAWQVLRRQPHLPSTWRLAYCAIRGH
jgi:glycosyltransferase involved in cell wall biosynthesis